MSSGKYLLSIPHTDRPETSGTYREPHASVNGGAWLACAAPEIATPAPFRPPPSQPQSQRPSKPDSHPGRSVCRATGNGTGEKRKTKKPGMLMKARGWAAACVLADACADTGRGVTLWVGR
jgi:hypothetical protein